MIARNRPIAGVVGIKDKKWSRSVQAGHGRQIEAANLCFSRSLERMVVNKHIEEQNRQREKISFGAGSGLAPNDLWGHEAGCAADSSALAVVHAHIVVVTDAHFAIFGVEKNVAEGYIAIAESFGVELSVVMRQFETGRY